MSNAQPWQTKARSSSGVAPALLGYDNRLNTPGALGNWNVLSLFPDILPFVIQTGEGADLGGRHTAHDDTSSYRVHKGSYGIHSRLRQVLSLLVMRPEALANSARFIY